MKRMAIAFLILGIVFIVISIYLFTRPEITLSQNETEVVNRIQSKPTSKDKGNMFEDFVIQYIAKRANGIRFIGKVSDYNKNGVFAEENFEPDLKFTSNESSFSVECKWRSNFNDDGAVIWSYPEQIERYNAYQKDNKTRVFIALGVGGSADNPHDFYLVPLYRLTKEFASAKYIVEFLIRSIKDLYKIIN